MTVTDADGRALKHGTGMLHIGGPERRCLVEGEPTVVLMVDKMADILTDMRNSGDLATIDQEGVITWAGRQDNRIKRLGQQVNLDSVQHLIASLVTGVHVHSTPNSPCPAQPLILFI